MDIKLIEGQFSSADALELLTQMIHVKIRFHENKIDGQSTEEDIKSRERRIKQLQKDLYEAQKLVRSKNGNVSILATVIMQ